jgi:hypothetical protein
VAYVDDVVRREEKLDTGVAIVVEECLQSACMSGGDVPDEPETGTNTLVEDDPPADVIIERAPALFTIDTSIGQRVERVELS